MKKQKKLFNLYPLYYDTLKIYLKQIDKIKNDDLNKLLYEFLENLNKITHFMIQGRFTPKNKNTSSISSNLKKSPAMVKYLDEGRKKIITPAVNLLDIIKFYKMLENFTLKRQYLESSLENFEFGKFSEHSSLIYLNLPTLLLSVDKLDASSRKLYLNIIFSAISIYRLFKVKSLPNSDTITKPYSGDDLIKHSHNNFSATKIGVGISQFVTNCGSTFKPHLYIYSGNASSPNSGSSSTKLLDDARAVINDTSLFRSILGISKHFEGFKHFEHLLTTLQSQRSGGMLSSNGSDMHQHMKNKLHSRLFHFTAQGGKARMIANVDWISQTALSAIHFLMFSILKSSKGDFTFDHKKGITHVMNCEAYKQRTKGYNFYSIDLSAATDRMPRYLQSLILAQLMNFLGYDGESIKNDGLNIVDREYSTKGTLINEGKPVRYEVGQGMGLFTSWPIMSLMHHYIINGICCVSGDRYALVGDDLLFFGSQQEYENYLDVMDSIGLQVNVNKTIQSTNNERPTIEFARNFVIDGIKITPIPFGVLFAGNERKVSFETLLGYFSENINTEILIDILNQFCFKITKLEGINILYYAGKNNIINIFDSRSELSKFKSIPAWITPDAFAKVKETTATVKAVQDMSNLYFNNDFMSTFRSQCTLRKETELLLAEDIAHAISALSRISTDLKYMSDIIYKRLTEADFLTFDFDLRGGPLLSKGERKLLEEINIYYSESKQ